MTGVVEVLAVGALANKLRSAGEVQTTARGVRLRSFDLHRMDRNPWVRFRSL